MARTKTTTAKPTLKKTRTSRIQEIKARYQERKITERAAHRIYKETPFARSQNAYLPENRKSRILGAIHQQIHQRRAATALQQGSLIPSSWIKSLAYDSVKQEAIAVFLTGTYAFEAVPESVFTNWWEGKATCQTTDSGFIKRWWRGKTPSLGAFFNQQIKGKYKSRRIR